MRPKLVKKPLSEMTIPEHKKRRGAYVIKMAIKGVALRQHPDALKAAARMALVMPVLQMIALVPILNVEIWNLLLGAEGLLIGSLAAGQLSSSEPESRLVGFGVAVFNTLALSVLGVFLGSHLFWITGLFSIVPITFLAIRQTRKKTIKRAWFVFCSMWLVVILLACVGRAALEISSSTEQSETRSQALDVAWVAFQIRGGHGTERGLFRLRQAQTAFADEDYAKAFKHANDGLQDSNGIARTLPESDLGRDVLTSLLRIKAQAFYNNTWNKDKQIFTPIEPEPLAKEALEADDVRVRWGW